MSAQSKSIHAVLVNAIGNVLIDLVLVDHGHGTIVRAVAITDEDHINKDVPDRVYKYGVY